MTFNVVCGWVPIIRPLFMGDVNLKRFIIRFSSVSDSFDGKRTVKVAVSVNRRKKKDYPLR